MIIAYLIGVAIFALIYGFNTKPSAARDGVRLVVTCLGWPIVLIASAGQAARMFNTRRLIEDAVHESARDL